MLRLVANRRTRESRGKGSEDEWHVSCLMQLVPSTSRAQDLFNANFTLKTRPCRHPPSNHVRDRVWRHDTQRCTQCHTRSSGIWH